MTNYKSRIEKKFKEKPTDVIIERYGDALIRYSTVRGPKEIDFSDSSSVSSRNSSLQYSERSGSMKSRVSDSGEDVDVQDNPNILSYARDIDTQSIDGASTNSVSGQSGSTLSHPDSHRDFYSRHLPEARRHSYNQK